MTPLISFFANAPANCVHQFLGLIPWFEYLPFNADCTLNLNLAPTATQPAHWNELWLIGIALLDDLLRIAGTVAVVMVIYGAIRYVTSQGEPENVKGAQSTILNALIGLVIAIVSVTAVNYIGNLLGGTVGPSGLPNIVADGNLVTTIFNLVFGIIGAASLLMIVLGGFKYVTSGGDSGRVNSAKNTILYSLIGLAVSAFAFAIVNFVIVKLA